MLREKVKVEDLVGLFRGDEDSTGYASAKLVVAMCEKLGPTSDDFLRRVLFGENVSWNDLSQEQRDAIREGYKLWRETGKGRR